VHLARRIDENTVFSSHQAHQRAFAGLTATGYAGARRNVLTTLCKLLFHEPLFFPFIPGAAALAAALATAFHHHLAQILIIDDLATLQALFLLALLAALADLRFDNINVIFFIEDQIVDQRFDAGDRRGFLYTLVGQRQNFVAKGNLRRFERFTGLGRLLGFQRSLRFLLCAGFSRLIPCLFLDEFRHNKAIQRVASFFQRTGRSEERRVG